MANCSDTKQRLDVLGTEMEAGAVAPGSQHLESMSRPAPPLRNTPLSPIAAPALAPALAPHPVGTPTKSETPKRQGIVRPQAPGSISLSPVRLGAPLPVSDMPSPLVPANDLPDDPQRASTAAHLYPLAPAWSPAGLSPSIRSDSGLASDSTFFASPSLSRSHSVSRARKHHHPLNRHKAYSSASEHFFGKPDFSESDIFERSTERRHPHYYSPKEAIDLATVPALDDAANAIVQDSTSGLEVVTPMSGEERLPQMSPWMGGHSLARSESATYMPRSPGPRSPVIWPASSAPRSPVFRPTSDLPDPSSGFLQAPNTRGHRRLTSDISGLARSMPSSTGGHARGLSTPSAPSPGSRLHEGHGMARTQSASSNLTNASGTQNALSIDGAIIYDGESAKVDHSLSGLANAIDRLSTNDNVPVLPSPMTQHNSSSYFALSPHVDDNTSHFPHSPGSPSLIRYRVLPGEHRPNVNDYGTPRAPRSPRSGVVLRQPPGQSPPSEKRGLGLLHVPPPASGDKKRISMLAYADILNEADEQLLVFDGAGDTTK